MTDKKNTYLRPESLESAVTLASENAKSFRYVAGGTDLFVNRFQGNESSECLIDITGINELKGCISAEGYYKTGSLTTLHELINDEIINREFKVLSEAAKSVASPLVRYSATVGGNLLCDNRCYYYNQSDWWRNSVGHCLKCEGDICIATGSKKACYSEFISDTAAALISLDAEIEIYNSGKKSRIILEDIYSGEGVNPSKLNHSDIITALYIPLGMENKSVYKKLRQRKSLEFTSLTSAVTLNKNNKLKIALAGVDSGPIVYSGTPQDDKEEIIKYFLKKARSVENDMYSREYRRKMIRVYLENSFKELGLLP